MVGHLLPGSFQPHVPFRPDASVINSIPGTSNTAPQVTEEEMRRYKITSQLCKDITSYHNDPQGFTPLLKEGWEVFCTSDDLNPPPQILKEYEHQSRNFFLLNLHTNELENPAMLDKAFELANVKNGYMRTESYFGLCMRNKETGEMIVVNRQSRLSLEGIRDWTNTNLSIALSSPCEELQDALLFGAHCQREHAKLNRSTFHFGGFSKGGFFAHVQQAVLKGSGAIGFDNPYLDDELLSHLSTTNNPLSIEILKERGGFVTVRSTFNAVNCLNSSSASYCNNMCVLIKGPRQTELDVSIMDSHNIGRIDSLVQEGHIGVMSTERQLIPAQVIPSANRSPSGPSSSSSSTPPLTESSQSTSDLRPSSSSFPSTSINPSCSSSEMNFKNDNASTTEKKSLAFLTEKFNSKCAYLNELHHQLVNDTKNLLNTDGPITPLEEAELEAITQQISKNKAALEETVDLGEGVLGRLVEELNKEENQAAVNTFKQMFSDASIELHKFRQAKLEAKRERIISDRYLGDQERKKALAEEVRNQRHQTFTLPEIERFIYSTSLPYNQISAHLHQMRMFIPNYEQTLSEIDRLRNERNQRKLELDGQWDRMEPIDTQLKQQFRNLYSMHACTIEELNKASMGVAIFSSLLFYGAGATVALSSASQARSCVFGIENTNAEMKKIRREERLRQKMETLQSTREKNAELSYSNNQELHALHKEEEHLINFLLRSDNTGIPREFRAALFTSNLRLLDNIANTKQNISNKEKEIENLRAQTIPFNTIKTQLEKELEDRANKILKRSRKNPSNNALITNLNNALALKFDSKYQKIARQLSDNEIPIISIDTQINGLEKEIGTLKSEAKTEEEKIVEIYNKRLQEERVAPLTDYFFNKVEDLDKRWQWGEPSNATGYRNETLDRGIALFNMAKEPERRVAGAICSESERLMVELTHILGILSNSDTEETIKSEQLKNNDNKRSRSVPLPYYLQHTVRFGAQIYKFVDTLETWFFKHNAFSKYFDAIRNGDSGIHISTDNNGGAGTSAGSSMAEILPSVDAMPTAGLRELFKEAGPLRVIGEYVVPTMQVMNECLVMVRLLCFLTKGCKRPHSPEENLLHGISDFLSYFNKQINSRFDGLEQLMSMYHSDVLDNINKIRSDTGILANEIVNEIESSKEEILSHQRTNEYNNRTVKIVKYGNNILRGYDDFLHTIQLKRQHPVKAVIDFYKNLHLGLKHDSNLPSRTGVFYNQGSTQNSKEFNNLVDIGLAAKNPAMYSGLIGINCNFNLPVPSLYLFNHYAKNYLKAKAQVEKNIGDAQPLQEISSKCRDRLKSQGEVLLAFCNYISPILLQTRLKQDGLINTAHRAMLDIQRTKQNYHSRMVQEAIIKHCRNFPFINPQKIVGKHKFHYANLFCRIRMASTYKITSNGWTTSIMESFLPTIIATVFSAVIYKVTKNKMPNIDIKKVGQGVGFLTTATFAGSVAYIKRQFMNERNRTTNHYGPRTILDMVIQRIPAGPSRQSAVVENIIEIWIDVNGGLSSNVESDTGLISSARRYVEPLFPNSKENSSFRARFKLISQDIPRLEKISQSGLITSKEIRNISREMHTVNDDAYNTQLTKLLNDYHAFLTCNGEPLPETNRFHQIQGRSRILTSCDTNTIPLAFPETLLQYLENKMEPEKSLMELSKVGFIIPRYRFVKDQTQGNYSISIEYHFRALNREDQPEDSLYCQFLIAEIDNNTVKAFSKPTFTQSPVNEPNLNELLIQMTYTNFVDLLGISGDKTVTLGNNQWVASAERVFPGLYLLWEKYPILKVNFKSNLYTEEMSRAAMEAVNGSMPLVDNQFFHHFLQPILPSMTGINMTVWKKIHATKHFLNGMQKDLIRNYQIVWAYCKLVTGSDDEYLREKLALTVGILDPKNFASLYDLITEAKKQQGLSEIELNRFKGIIECMPSKPLKKLRLAMQHLKK